MAVLLVAALVLVATPWLTSAQGVLPGETLVHTMGWNTGAGGWQLVVGNCTAAQVSSNTCSRARIQFALGAAARTGAGGARVTINWLSGVAASVQLRSPLFTLVRGVAYTPCLWAKGSALSRKQSRFAAVRQTTSGGNVTLSNAVDRSLTIRRTWERICLADMIVYGNNTVFFALNLGTINAGFPYVLDLDDVQITSMPTGPAATWVTDAAVAKRIDTVRKGNFTLRFQLPDGAAGNLTNVQATLQRHSFAVGTCVEVDKKYDGSRRVRWRACDAPDPGT
jgi:hypothetical protein